MALLVVDALEVVEVEEADGQRATLHRRLLELHLQLLLEVPVVSEPGQGVGQREPHRTQGAVRRALVERDRDERPGQRQHVDRRLRPQHDEREADRGHDREGRSRPDRGRAQDGREGLTRPAGEDRGDERDVDRVERRGAGEHLEHEARSLVVVREQRHRGSRGRGREREDRAVVDQLDHGSPLDKLERDPGEDGHDDRRRPAVQDPRADDEHGGERQAASRKVLDRDRRGLEEERGEKQRDHAARCLDRQRRRHELPRGGRHGGKPPERDREQHRVEPPCLLPDADRPDPPLRSALRPRGENARCAHVVATSEGR